MADRYVDEDGYVWEWSDWHGDWLPVEDWAGYQVREGGFHWGPGRSEQERRREVEEENRLCLITTACVRSRGLPDDCEELERFRAFRDEYVAGAEGGRELVEEYYATAPEIVAAIDRRPDAAGVYDALYEELVVGTLGLLDAGDREGAYRRGLAIYEALRAEYRRKSADGT